MPHTNANLKKAYKAKNDEFMTLMPDIEAECSHYTEQFKDQWIYCPCDDESSNFWIYFYEHFAEFGLKHLTASHINFTGKSYRLDYDGSTVIKTPLNGNGDFRSEECCEIRDKANLIITNPPFSLLRHFVYWMGGGNFEKNDKGEWKRSS